MKAQKLLSLDVELINLLKQEENASGLVNDLLKEYYHNTRIDNMSLDQLEKLKKKAELQKQIEELDYGN